MRANIGCLTILLALAACGGQQTHQPVLQPTSSSPGVSSGAGDIGANDPRVHLFNSALRLEPSESALEAESDSEVERERSNVSFTYVASVDAPKNPETGRQVQATAFDFFKDRALVVYNTAGEEVSGALEVVDMSRWKEPKLLSTLFFKDAEFSDIKVKDKFAFLVGTEGGDRWGGVFKVVDISDDDSPKEVASISLYGFAATSLVVEGDEAYVTVGNNFGVYRIDVSKPEMPVVLQKFELPEAKFVLTYEKEILALGGKDSTDLWQMRDDRFVSVGVLSRDVYEAPGRMSQYKNLLYTNAGRLGLHIYDMKDVEKGEFEELASREVKGTGNGIDVSYPYAFLAQGEAGTFVYNVKKSKSPYAMGSFDFRDDRGSANNLRYGKPSGENVIMIADGLGGFRIVQFEIRH